MKQIGKNIRKIRTDLGLTIEEVAERAGVCFKSVWNLEKGKQTSMRLFLSVCCVLGVKVSLKNKEE